MIEAARNFAVSSTWLPDRPLQNMTSLVNQDVGALQQGIAQETVGVDVLVFEIVLHILVAGHALKPAQWRHHGKQQMQFSVFRYLGLE